MLKIFGPEVIGRIKPELALLALRFMDTQKNVPWCAVGKDEGVTIISFPEAIAEAQRYMRGKSHLSLRIQTEFHSRKFLHMQLPPSNELLYEEAMEQSFGYPLDCLSSDGLISGERDPLWNFLQKINNDFVNSSTDGVVRMNKVRACLRNLYQ